jgi:hypothetical protein
MVITMEWVLQLELNTVLAQMEYQMVLALPLELIMVLVPMELSMEQVWVLLQHMIRTIMALDPPIPAFWVLTITQTMLLVPNL